MKTKVKISGDGIYKLWKDGDTGYIDGYVTDKHGKACAVVILDKNKQFILVSVYALEEI
jgi:hypothetical protein